MNKVRPNILNLAPYSSARDEFEGNGEIFLDANENPNETGLNRYPDPYQLKLKEQIASLKKVDPNQIFLGNGSDEAIDLVMRIFCEPGKDNIVISNPSYGMYAVSAAINNVAVKKVALSENFGFTASGMLKKADSNTKMVFICSPNNPSGNTLNAYEISKVIENFDGIVVIDEAYIDFSEQSSFILQLDKYKNLIILQTFSKAWGLAGVRLGMAFSSPDIIKLMNKVKPPYNINILTQKEVLQALDNKKKVKEAISNILQEREFLISALSNLSIVNHIFPSDSNFLLIRFNDSQPIFKYLTEKRIIIRDRSKVKHGENCLRVTVGTPEENRNLIKALKEYQS
ncbi:histidinol-phosphate transaminase [Fulvivirga marina]|nr:histidinol-phosphate transaminase [Fulvivirga marina]